MQNTISKILDLDIVDVLSKYIDLKKEGTNYKANCPFHNEKTPSFIVSSKKGIFKCFGCGEGGNAIGFVMKHEKLDFIPAAKKISKDHNIIWPEAPMTDKEKKAYRAKEKMSAVNKYAEKYFTDSLKGEALKYAKKRWPDEIIKLFGIGYAPDKWQGLDDYFRKKSIKQEAAISAGVLKKSEGGKVYDAFRKRVVFPIYDEWSRVIAFSGRDIPEIKNLTIKKQPPKYINTPETILYKKRAALYGIHAARKSIKEKEFAYLVEGNPDVIRLHSLNINNTVGTCGTSLTLEHVRKLKKICNSINIIGDSDDAGKKAMLKSGKMIIEAGMNCNLIFLPEKEDPDSFFKDKSRDEFKHYIKDNIIDYIIYQGKAWEKKANNPDFKAKAINDICRLIIKLDSGTHDFYIDQLAKSIKPKKAWTDKLKSITEEAEEFKEVEELPENVNAEEFKKYGFYEHNNEYYFSTKHGIMKLSNFTMKPAFHVDSTYDNKRIFEITNKYGYSVTVDLDMNEMTSLQSFQKNIEGKGNFLFTGQMSHFQKLKLKLYEETRTCREITNLGWQKEGFWVWSNGMINPNTGEFEKIDKFGIITHNEDNYYIPAFSKIYLNDKTVFIEERKFKHEQKEVDLQQWQKLFLEVHGPNAMVGFAFYLASLFRDHLLWLNDNFPILNLYGQRGSGKNTLAYSLLSLFGKRQVEYNIHNGTKAGLAKHLETFRNAIALLDEYKNNIDYDIIETLKSIYNAIGRSRINADRGMKKETTEVNTAAILAGQEMPTVDIALSTRVLFLQFDKKENLSMEAKKKLEDLQAMERDGLSHITNMFIRQRKYFIENYKDNYTSVINDIIDKTKGEEIDDRLIRNMTAVVSAFKTFEKKFKFVFSYKDMLEYGVKVIKDHNDQLQQSDEVGIFWNLIEAMFDDNLLIENWHFKINHKSDIKTTQGDKHFPEGKRILEFKFNSVAKLYAEQLKKRGEKPLPQDSLKHYLQTNKYFLGVCKSSKFILKHYDSKAGEHKKQSQTTTSFAFDYDKLDINIDRDDVIGEVAEEAGNIDKQAETDDVPF